MTETCDKCGLEFNTIEELNKHKSNAITKEFLIFAEAEWKRDKNE